MIMAAVFFTQAAERDVKRLPQKTQEILRTEHIPELAANPRAGKQLHGPLRGYFSYEFFSEGVPYRIAYELMRGDVVILMISLRDNFYRKFTRRAR